MIKRREVFYGKILLFGEYSVIFNSMALTIPYTHFKGQLSFISNYKYTDFEWAKESNNSIREFANYLKSLQEKGELLCPMNLKKLDADLEKGLYFESTIPQGYGVGSSGALVAAIYDEYAEEKIQSDRNLSKKSIFKLKAVFAQMESYFHGKSSGLDPLNCYIQYPLLIKNTSEIKTVGIPRNKFDKKGAIFLINSGKPGKTAPLVNRFLENYKEKDYKQAVDNELIPLNNSLINTLLEGRGNEFFELLKQLSDFQLKYFDKMIPEAIRKVWHEGVKTEKYSLKLCGSGGGGFMLGFTTNYEDAKKILLQQGFEIITVYKNS
ncbi:MAG: mevalonate kinase [Bacteroidetes bacterium]|nr:MAG: mevalonate kinase [Bacteroidota bacterium]